MSIYEELSVRPLINAGAHFTRLGGSVMPRAVVEAMVEAAKHHINLEELQRAVGKKLAELTHNEAAYVSCGAAAGITIATAALVAGDDPRAINQLPDTTGLKNEVIIHKAHRNGYDHAIRQVGVKIVEIGTESKTEPAELEAAISDKTAAIFWFEGLMTGPGDIPLPTVIEIANRYGVPVVVDGADQVPPAENLWRFTQMGAALAIFSGGKDLRGPQSSGLVVGRADIIEKMRVNGNPHASIGRPMKVGKEEMVGLLTAVKLYLTRDHEARVSQDEETVVGWCSALNRVPGVRAERAFPGIVGQPMPRARVTIDAAQAGMSGEEIIEALRAGTPSIEVHAEEENEFFLNPMTLQEGEDQIVLDRLLAILRKVG
jgi:L-seryl-tRNA(Ser) seleniumtransferase